MTVRLDLNGIQGLLLIPAVSHSAASCPRESFGTDEAEGQKAEIRIGLRPLFRVDVLRPKLKKDAGQTSSSS